MNTNAGVDEKIFEYKTGTLPNDFNWKRNFTSTQLLKLSKNVLVNRCGSAFWPVLGAMILWSIPNAIPVVNYMIMLFGIYFYIGLMRFHLNIVRNEKFDFSTIWSGFSTHLTLIPLGVGVLIMLATWGGLILLIIPGLYFNIKFCQSIMIMIDNPKLGSIDVMKESWRLTDGFEWKIVGLWFHCIWMFLLMLITIGIASYWLLPRLSVAFAMLYENMKAVNK